jgi:hypothetical protein
MNLMNSFGGINAVCINQQEGTERTYQIQLMRDIFLEASFAIYWLDSKDGQVGLGFRWIKVIAGAILGYFTPALAKSFYFRTTQDLGCHHFGITRMR